MKETAYSPIASDIEKTSPPIWHSHGHTVSSFSLTVKHNGWIIFLPSLWIYYRLRDC